MGQNILLWKTVVDVCFRKLCDFHIYQTKISQFSYQTKSYQTIKFHDFHTEQYFCLFIWELFSVTFVTFIFIHFLQSKILVRQFLMEL